MELARVFLDQIEGLSKNIAKLEKVTAHEATCGETTRRLQTMPGVGPIAALAIETFAPPMDVFKRGRDFIAWLGLVPRQQSTGGKQVLGKISKMGQRDIRRLLIIGAMAVVRAAVRKGAPEEAGYSACWRANQRCWWRLRSPTKWRARSGPCWRREKISEFRRLRRSERASDEAA